jgi:transposase
MKDVKSRVSSSASMNALFCGLDVHKESTYATIINVFGEIQTQKRMKNEEIPKFLEPFQVEKIAMEASTYIMPLHRKLTEEGYDITVSHPRKTKLIAESRIKNDKVDSKALAELLRLNALPESYIPPRDVFELREKVRRRAFLVRQVSKLKVKIRDIMAYEGVKPPEGYGLFTRKGVEWLSSLNLEPVDCYLRLMKPFQLEILRISKELRTLARDDTDVGLLETIPGIGYYIALLIKAEVGDIKRFKSRHHLASYAGLVPSTKSSGNVQKHGKITREGSAWLRWAMVEAAMVHIRYDTSVTRLYHRVAERRGKKKALVAAGRELLTVCYSVLVNQRPYFNSLQTQA